MVNHNKDYKFLVQKFVESNQRKRINLLPVIESDVDNLFLIGKKLFNDFEREGDDSDSGKLQIYVSYNYIIWSF